MVTVDLAEDSRDVWVGDTPQLPVRAALQSPGEPYASEMAAGASDALAERRPQDEPQPLHIGGQLEDARGGGA